ncbi:PP2C family protein-serine/threonine phosphatase [Cellulomonas sp. ATA003]|uniref:PP2C family protein-serine/threonine phosphatase n=1 Tax=Cellulomonas sp. ATA003 TaxID=3073064 RepID=UPI002872B0B7|nr:PP2C family protein-serine/threonine phosphatase [Cellulomonas sp. ATA003]WNB86916.1 PP2C family protein-serine/threonine phosphatase [Cellulomonas sp. ATA003]
MASVHDDRILAALRTLLDRAHLATPGQIPDVVAAAAAELGWTTILHLVDIEQRTLIPFSATGTPPAEPQSIEGTLAGRAFKLMQPVVAHGGEPAVWVPLLDGTHRLGVLRVAVPVGTDLAEPSVEDAYRLLTHLAGHLVAAKSPYGDALAQVARSRERTVATELLWDLLPPLTFGCEGMVISAILEPCYDVAADAFDYSVVDDVAHLAVLDATGHDLRGTVVAAVALAALRNSRREGRGLEDTVRVMDRYVRQQGHGEIYATGVVGRLDLPTGRLRYVNAGHPAPLLVRHGKVVKQLTGGRRMLLGLGREEVVVGEEQLEPADRIVLYTDGITEARDDAGQFFGLDRLVGHLERSAAAGLPAPETLRRLTHDVLDHQKGVLQDDATLVLAQWASGEEHTFTSGLMPASASLGEDGPRR